jgi:hypothetical protein
MMKDAKLSPKKNAAEDAAIKKLMRAAYEGSVNVVKNLIEEGKASISDTDDVS